MNYENLGIVVLFVGFIGAAIYGSTGESSPPPPMKDKLVYVIRVPSPSPLTP